LKAEKSGKVDGATAVMVVLVVGAMLVFVNPLFLMVFAQ
jgi:hypothetical protein